MMELLSKALSAMKPLRTRPSMSGTTPTVSKGWPGKNKADEIAERVGQRQNFGRHAAFGTADGLALSPLLRSVRGGGP
ncbi:hypothetical protein ABIF50_008232 [Bradyrhizobium diazoefficiens]